MATARMRRLASDYEQVMKDFGGHKNIIVTPVGDDLPEKYNVTYFVNGIYLLEDGRIETQGRHEVEITLHADYPRYKPLCKILTPIWHPNFRDGQICIGDIWGAGESLSDIIINIGDMIQYKSWNSLSPLSADAAQWAIENQYLFPVGNIDLYVADHTTVREPVEIDLFGDDDWEARATNEKLQTSTTVMEEKSSMSAAPVYQTARPAVPVYQTVRPTSPAPVYRTARPTPDYQDRSSVSVPVISRATQDEGNDFDITAEELEGIEFVPTVDRVHVQTVINSAKGKKMNFKTVLTKGVIWALIGALIGFIATELTRTNISSDKTIATLCGHEELATYFSYRQKAEEALLDNMDVETYFYYNGKAEAELAEVFESEYHEDFDELQEALALVSTLHTAVWSAGIALFVGLFMGVGEGVYYGSAQKAIRYAFLGAAVSLALGFAGGYLAQLLYGALLKDEMEGFVAAVVRGFGWSIMGMGVGVAVGLIKPDKKRILFCGLGGFFGAFVGGTLFNYVYDILPNDIAARGVGIVVMGILIGIGVGMLEQFAKTAWLKVIRGEFEGKEYLVFNGVTSIGNNSKNTIVLFKDKLVAPHHCDIRQEGSKYVIVDTGTPMGTVVNGQKTNRHVLRQGDAIAIGNSVLVFNVK